LSSWLTESARWVEAAYVSEDTVQASSAPAPAAARVAGQHARATRRRYVRNSTLAVAALMAVLILGITVLGFGWATVGLEAAVIAVLLCLENAAAPLIQRWTRGAQGEERVGAVLDELRGRGWFALHDVNLDKGNIDHVVVGPAGIYTIETKSHHGRISAHKIDARMLKQAYAEAKLVERITGLRAEPLLVFSSAFVRPAVTRREGVVILPARLLGKHLQDRRGAIPQARVLEVYNRLASALPG
jgi:Nuclease-related domain